MAIHRRDFMKAAAVSAGALSAIVGSVRSVVPKAKAGDKVGDFDKVPIVNGDLAAYPPFEKWDSWKELSGEDWKRGGLLRHDVKVHEHMLVPTICNNCEAVCGLTAWVDKETLTVRKYMGNPLHTGSKGRNCAKGYAVQSQMYDPDRIPFPLKRAPGSKRGDGRWVRTTWDEALDTIGKKMNEVLKSGDALAKKSIMHHVGRPNESGFTGRVWASLGQDFQNSHTNICSANGRFGSLLWTNDDRSAPDWENARLIFLISSHAADAGHYFQQAAGQIAAARKKGAKLVVLDPRLSNSAGIADLWIPCWPGSEAAIQLAIGAELIRNQQYDRHFIEQWWNWQDFMAATDVHQLYLDRGFLSKLPSGDSFEAFEAVLMDLYGRNHTLEWAAQEARVPVSMLRKLYDYVVYAGDRISSFFWRASAAGNRGGWMSSSRAGIFLLSLTGNFGGVGALGVHHGRYISVGGKGHAGTAGGKPEHVDEWNELSWPPEWPLASYELSFLLPHLLTDTEWQKKWQAKGLTVPSKVPVWIPRMYNPVWINPDGFRWIEVLRDESKMELTFNPSPIWSETNWFMDYILPVGLSGERHDQHSEPTNVEAWAGFRQPVLRVALEKMGWEPKDPARATLEAHMKAGLGEIWEENELWINLAFKADPDGSLGVRKYWESKLNPGKPVTIAEYYDAAFRGLPKLKAAAEKAAADKAKKAKTPLEKKLAAFAQKFPCYDLMRDRGAWTEETHVYEQHKHHLHKDEAAQTVTVHAPQFWGGKVTYPLDQVQTDARTKQLYVETEEGRHNIGVVGHHGEWEEGFETPSRKLDFYAAWMKDWGWPEYSVPIYPVTDAQKQQMEHVVSHVHHAYMTEPNAFALNTIFRLPYNIHTRSVNSKWLMEISQNHAPLWMAARDAERLGFRRGDPVKVKVVDTVSGLESGYFIAQCQPTEGQAPGTLSCSHHAGRWRVMNDIQVEGFDTPLHMNRMGTPEVEIKEQGTVRTMHPVAGIQPFAVKAHKEFGEKGWPYAEFNHDLHNIKWDGLSGVWQNATHHPHPDPLSGMHCWHQKVVLEKPGPGEKVGDLKVDIQATYDTYKAWRDKLTRPAPGPGGLRRPEHLKRPWVPLTRSAYKMPTT
ncbi:MAG: molybdopterin-dependent oxidoreductase [Myxococcales bacterium]|nr:molybdopterin-dependent oxidoreductase [Myxococcales bacterium]